MAKIRIKKGSNLRKKTASTPKKKPLKIRFKGFSRTV